MICTNMKTKIIPFDLEIAKEIQTGKTKGCIMCNDEVAHIIDLDMYFQSKKCICAQICDNSGKYITNLYNTNGTDADCTTGCRLYIELQYSDNESQFKSFDKVLVRDSDDEEWSAALFSHMTNLESPYACVGNLFVCQCIPYEGNQELVGTTKTPKNF